MDIEKEAEPCIFWKLGRGNISFWWDNWTSLGPLATLVQATRTSKNTKVKEFIHEGNWKYDNLLACLPASVANSVVKVEINEKNVDFPYWLPENNGTFTCKSAWQTMRRKRGGTLTCIAAQHTRRKHCPIYSVIAKLLDRKKWSSLCVTPVYSDCDLLGNMVEHMCSKFPNLQLPQLWIDKCQYVEKLQLSIHSQAVRWSKPDRGWVKLNVDGCSKGNPGLAGGGGIIRDHHGNMMKAFAEFYGPCSNNLAEAKALLHGVKLCSNSGFLKVHVESDSMFTVNMINKRMLPSWQIKHIIEQIWEVTSTGDFKFTHTFREGNTVADQLANLGVNSQNCAIFNEVVLLPTKVRASMKLDQDGLPNF
ncbi:uncharacterized protein LOC142161999 [Nicotiana tabacum]|uniref:Uncharacterized protein LOC142161999 n=1 Tax=Nicotiana tabacum TaxID=4097 RepID=A0AC58RNV8_TOBAC